VREFAHRLFNVHKFVRRVTLAWACWLITIVVLRVTEPEVLEHVDGGVATVVTAVIGILATVIGFYQWSRSKEEKDDSVPH
jgi:hypothetical protein